MAQKQHQYPVVDSPFWLHIEMLMQKGGAIILLLIVVAALGGLFSQGWLSAKTASSADHALTVHYDRFARLQSDIDMQLTANPAQANRAVFTLGGDFMQDFEIRTLQPQPLKMYSQNGELVLEYARPQADKPFTVWLGLTPQGVGSSDAQISLNGAAPVAVKQFIWP